MLQPSVFSLAFGLVHEPKCTCFILFLYGISLYEIERTEQSYFSSFFIFHFYTLPWDITCLYTGASAIPNLRRYFLRRRCGIHTGTSGDKTRHIPPLERSINPVRIL